MNHRREQREALGLTQIEAAANAGISLATWRRWEEDPRSVRASTRVACEAVFSTEHPVREDKTEIQAFERSWQDCSYLTPRQAYALAATIDLWADLYIGEWLKDPSCEPLHQVSPFDQLDLRIMMHVNESRSWAAKVAERCYAVSDEIAKGVLPFDREGAYMDELLIAMSLSDAQVTMEDIPELFDELPARASEDERVGDEDWDAVSSYFDDQCRWDEWEVPLYREHPLLPPILAERHPFTWFDNIPASGAGYLNRLMGREVLVTDGQDGPAGTSQ